MSVRPSPEPAQASELYVSRLTLGEAARIMREAMKDKSYRAFPLGQEAGRYLRAKRKRLTKDSYRDYESSLDKLARHFPDLELADLEPPVGTERLEEFLDSQWGDRTGRTYNKNLSILRDFFKWAILRGRLRGDPTLSIERARKAGVHRETFTPDQVRAIIAAQAELRDRIAVRLLLDYGLRKGALAAVRFQHFDHYRKRLTIFTKGQKVRNVRIPHPEFWHDLGRLLIDAEAQPGDFLVPSRVTRAIAYDHPGKGRHATEFETRMIPGRPMGAHGLHDWWYGCLERAGLVEHGTTRGERMHKARHTAGQRVLDATGNLKAAQRLLGHSSIQTTADVYVDWDDEQLAETMSHVVEDT